MPKFEIGDIVYKKMVQKEDYIVLRIVPLNEFNREKHLLLRDSTRQFKVNTFDRGYQPQNPEFEYLYTKACNIKDILEPEINTIINLINSGPDIEYYLDVLKSYNKINIDD